MHRYAKELRFGLVWGWGGSCGGSGHGVPNGAATSDKPGGEVGVLGGAIEKREGQGGACDSWGVLKAGWGGGVQIERGHDHRDGVTPLRV